MTLTRFNESWGELEAYTINEGDFYGQLIHLRDSGYVPQETIDLVARLWMRIRTHVGFNFPQPTLEIAGDHNTLWVTWRVSGYYIFVTHNLCSREIHWGCTDPNGVLTGDWQDYRTNPFPSELQSVLCKLHN